MPAPMVMVPFQFTLSAFAFSKLSVIVAFLVTGSVMLAKFTISSSSAWVRQVMAFGGRVTRFRTVFFACFLFPCTVTNVITIADAPGSRDGVSTKPVRPRLLIATLGGGSAPGPCTTKPSFGCREGVPSGVCCAVVNHCTCELSPGSPVDVLVIRVAVPDPSNPSRASETDTGCGPVLVTTFKQRRNAALWGTNTFRVSWRLSAGKVCVWKTSWRFLPPCGQSSDARFSPGLNTSGSASAWPSTAVTSKPLKPLNAFVSGTFTWRWIVKTVVKPKNVVNPTKTLVTVTDFRKVASVTAPEAFELRISGSTAVLML